MDNQETGVSLLWKYDVFLGKLDKMKEMANHFYETGEQPEIDPAEDPFHGKASPSLIG